MTAREKYKMAVLTSYFPSISKTVGVNHIKGLIDAGFDVTILARKKQPISKSSQPKIINDYRLLEKAVEYLPHNSQSLFKKLMSYILIHPKIWGKSLGLIKFSKGDRTARIKIFLQQRAFKKLARFDFYHAHFGLNGLHIAAMHRAGIINAPFAVTFHGIGAHANKGNDFFAKQHPCLFDNASFITANSTYLRDNLTLLGCPNNKLAGVPIEVDTPFDLMFVDGLHTFRASLLDEINALKFVYLENNLEWLSLRDAIWTTKELF